ncbi:MAG TPA: 8-amino-7-oxononanoate synthase [Planctomycetaceae bacterium]|nr:8-amino-7-oxononanoate synthase [Planctomycetaceae bacterium]
MSAADDWSRRYTQAISTAGEQRRLRKPRGPHKNCTDLGSNDYLQLSRDRRVIEAAAEQLSCTQATFGAGASPVIGGHTDAHELLHRKLSELTGVPVATFSSGYSANVGTLACLVDKSGLILSDELNHASLIDGCRLSGATRIIFPHLDYRYLEQALQEQREQFSHCIIVTESVFSMDGDQADLPKLWQLAEQYECALVIDEAHATGLYDQGRGLLAAQLALDFWPENLIKLGTLSKAVGSIGGFVCGTATCIDFIVNHCRSYLFSTAAPAACAAASAAAVSLLPQIDDRRERLFAISQRLRRELNEAGWQVDLTSDSPIVPIIVGDEGLALSLSEWLLAQRFSVPAIRPPTVPSGKSRLRVSLNSGLTDSELSRFVEAMRLARTEVS